MECRLCDSLSNALVIQNISSYQIFFCGTSPSVLTHDVSEHVTWSQKFANMKSTVGHAVRKQSQILNYYKIMFNVTFTWVEKSLSLNFFKWISLVLSDMSWPMPYTTERGQGQNLII